MSTHIDLEHAIAESYRAIRTPQVIDVPQITYLMVDGHGDPNTSAEYRDAIQALYALSYWVKFAIKRSGGPNHKVGPLEGLWWSPDMHGFATADKSAWNWTAMIAQPAEVTPELLAQAVREVTAKTGRPTASAVRLAGLTEGRAAQIMHVGPYADEGPTIAQLHAFIAEAGGHFDGREQKHHEIYLGDPRRAAPQRLRTIIRQPFVLL